jgi:hypothetical protein
MEQEEPETTPQILQQIKRMTEHENHGKVVWRHHELHKKYACGNLLQKIQLVVQLILQPLGHLLFWIVFIGFPNVYTYFGGTLHVQMSTLLMYVVSSLQVAWGCFTGWKEVAEYQQLSTTLMIWKLLTLRLQVPTITIHSSETQHQNFKWSAGASLLFHNI